MSAETPMQDQPDPFVDLNREEAKLLPPDYSLKKAIGEDVDLKQVFSEENIAKAQGSIDKHKDSFLEWAVNDVAALGAHHAKAVADSAEAPKEIESIEHIADRLKSQAGTFNFGLATLVAKSLANFCNAHKHPGADHLLVVSKHVDTLTVIFNKKITGDGGAIGAELLDNLTKLVEKYK